MLLVCGSAVLVCWLAVTSYLFMVCVLTISCDLVLPVMCLVVLCWLVWLLWWVCIGCLPGHLGVGLMLFRVRVHFVRLVSGFSGFVRVCLVVCVVCGFDVFR